MNLLRRTVDRAGRFVFDARNAYYEYASDLKQVKGEALLQLVNGRVQDGVTTSDRLFDAYQGGQISLSQMRDALATELRRANSQMFALGRGGWRQVTAEDRALLTERLKQEFDYLRGFMRGIADGKLSEAQIRDRLSMYSEHTRSSFWDGQTAAKADAGYTQERRVLAAAIHCKDCPDYAAQGWQPINTLPSPGLGCQCGARCKCEMEYR